MWIPGQTAPCGPWGPCSQGLRDCARKERAEQKGGPLSLALVNQGGEG